MTRRCSRWAHTEDAESRLLSQPGGGEWPCSSECSQREAKAGRRMQASRALLLPLVARLAQSRKQTTRLHSDRHQLKLDTSLTAQATEGGNSTRPLLTREVADRVGAENLRVAAALVTHASTLDSTRLNSPRLASHSHPHSCPLQVARAPVPPSPRQACPVPSSPLLPLPPLHLPLPPPGPWCTRIARTCSRSTSSSSTCGSR